VAWYRPLEPELSAEFLDTLCNELGFETPEDRQRLIESFIGFRQLRNIYGVKDAFSPAQRIKRMEIARHHFKVAMDIVNFPINSVDLWTNRHCAELDTSWRILEEYANVPERTIYAPVTMPSRAQIALKSTIDELQNLIDAIDLIIEREEARKATDPSKRREPDQAIQAVLAQLASIYRNLTSKEPGFSHGGDGSELGGPFLRFVSPVLRELGWRFTDKAIRARYRRIPAHIMNPPRLELDPREVFLHLLSAEIQKYGAFVDAGARIDIDEQTGRVTGQLLEYLRPGFEMAGVKETDEDVCDAMKNLVKYDLI
jgi:hypothetical protein